MRLDAIIILAVLIIIVLCILYFPIFFRLKRKGTPFFRQVSYILFIWSIAMIIFATIFFMMPNNFSPEMRTVNLIPFIWLRDGINYRIEIFESIFNVLMFVPFGFFLPLVFKKCRQFSTTLGIAFLFTLTVESTQFFIGRIADVDDIITNVLGALIGYGFFKCLNGLLKDLSGWTKIIGEK